jgi:hypothetical protein
VALTAWARSGPLPAEVRVHAPGGMTRVRMSPSDGGVARARFTPPRPGTYRVDAPGAASVGFRAERDAPSADWAELARLAAASGGVAAPADSIARMVRSQAAGSDRGVPPWLWPALLVGLATAEWTLRRLRGRP